MQTKVLTPIKLPYIFASPFKKNSQSRQINTSINNHILFINIDRIRHNFKEKQNHVFSYLQL